MLSTVGPVTAVLLTFGILLLNTSGVALLAEPLVAMLVLTLAAAASYLFRPRESSSRGDHKRQGRIWRTVVPVAALLAGLGAAAILWALVVFVVERHHYVSTYERMEQLPPALGVGVFVGVPSFIVTLVWVIRSSRKRS